MKDCRVLVGHRAKLRARKEQRRGASDRDRLRRRGSAEDERGLSDRVAGTERFDDDALVAVPRDERDFAGDEEVEPLGFLPKGGHPFAFAEGPELAAFDELAPLTERKRVESAEPAAEIRRGLAPAIARSRRRAAPDGAR